MEHRPLIRRVVLENYKSISFCDVKLPPLVILVGPNGAGKSNFLDALRFLSDAIGGSLDKAFQSRSGFSNVLRRGVAEKARLGFRIEFLTSKQVIGYYSVRLARGNVADYVLEREKCRIGVGPGLFGGFEAGSIKTDYLEQVPPNYEGNLYLHLPRLFDFADSTDPDQHKFLSVSDMLSSCQFYNFGSKDLRQPVPIGGLDRVLLGDGTNLFNVLRLISREHRSLFDRIVQYLRAIDPAVSAIESLELGDFLTLQFHENTEVFYPGQVSDGTLRALAVLVALFQPGTAGGHISLVGIEEPESALHPAAAGVLFDALREASASVQVIATTHSADLLDKREIDSDSILSVDQDLGRTRVGHVDQTGRKALKDQLYTAGDLMRMNYLRPESSQVPTISDIEALLFAELVPA
jgi:predicted ATPase